MIFLLVMLATGASPLDEAQRSYNVCVRRAAVRLEPSGDSPDDIARAAQVLCSTEGAATILPIIAANIDRETHLMTDEARHYRRSPQRLGVQHSSVHHGKGIYSRNGVTTNTIEGFFSIFKRGMKGVYQHCAEKHLHRYMAEFDFRYTNREANGFNDGDRSVAALRGIVGKRLTYGGPVAAN